MTFAEIVNRIDADERFAVERRTPDVVVKGRGGRFILDPVEGDLNWEDYERMLLGERYPRVMTHMTRIVGYYSEMQNWNRSKLAELKDRQKGDYAVAP
ncbi:MAG TPA: hypothetical protein VNI20_11675 [Fimbriimonadaceae bacterium]|nr:hypothetical protein [Fimbriimonadaceae bacterium]